MIRRLILFGATGDLAGRFLLPALAELLESGAVPSDLEVVAAAVEDWTDDAYRRHADQRLGEHARAVSPRPARASSAGSGTPASTSPTATRWRSSSPARRAPGTSPCPRPCSRSTCRHSPTPAFPKAAGWRSRSRSAKTSRALAR